MPNVVLEIITPEQIKSFALDELSEDSEDSVRNVLIDDKTARDIFGRVLDAADYNKKEPIKMFSLTGPLRRLRNSLQIYCDIAEKNLATPLVHICEYRVGLRMKMIRALESVLDGTQFNDNVANTDCNHDYGNPYRDDAADFETARRRDYKALEELYNLYQQLQPSRTLIQIAEVIQDLQNDLEKFSVAPGLAAYKSRN